MAGTTILSGSLVTSTEFSLPPRFPAHRTVEAVLEAIKNNIFGNAENTRKRRWVLVAYSLYSLLMDSDRYKTKFLLPLRDPEGLGHCYEGVGDFALSDEDGRLYECVQVVPYNTISPASVMEGFAEV